MTVEEFCNYYFNKIKSSLPDGATFSHYHTWNDKVIIFYKYGKNKDSHFSFNYQEYLIEERNNKIDGLLKNSTKNN